MAGGLSAEAGPEKPEAKDMTVLKHSSIVVRVEEALADLLVVSYRPQDADALYQGVLLHSKKRDLPYGVSTLHPAFSEQIKVEDGEDRLYSVSQRFGYQEPQYARALPPVAKGKPRARQKMTVRLRPRKVLCSKCQGICNENSESVDTSRKRKLTRQTAAEDEKTLLMGNSLIPKLSRLQPSEISEALNGYNKTCSPLPDVQSSRGDENSEEKLTRDLTFVNVTNDLAAQDGDDKTVEESSATSFGSVFSSARTLKICFGEGEGTVVKLPANVGDFNDVSGVPSDAGKTLVVSKAAKRALKKAKKQAKKSVAPAATPVMSPRHMGALSPRNNVPVNAPLLSITDTLQKRHRHKVKHKKKRKIERQRDENTTKPDGLSDADDCSDQKLSINLKRSSRNSCTRRASESGSEAGEEGVPEFPTGSACEGGGAGGGGGASAGDVVWGKLAGFPWWPGRVRSVVAGVAHVSWYASTTCSHIHSDCLSPFLDDYKTRFNKKKRGAYKEAVRLATLDARKKEQDPLGNGSPSILPTVSPRPIDVFS